MDVPLILTAATVIFTKILDIHSTLLRLKKPGGGTFNNKCGFIHWRVKKTRLVMFFLVNMAFIIGTWFLFDHFLLSFYKWLFIIPGIYMALMQLAVAHTNYTGSLNFITRNLVNRSSTC
jgi:hypothetical protein